LYSNWKNQFKRDFFVACRLNVTLLLLLSICYDGYGFCGEGERGENGGLWALGLNGTLFVIDE
jgi:hypothetical protein